MSMPTAKITLFNKKRLAPLMDRIKNRCRVARKVTVVSVDFCEKPHVPAECFTSNVAMEMQWIDTDVLDEVFEMNTAPSSKEQLSVPVHEFSHYQTMEIPCLDANTKADDCLCASADHHESAHIDLYATENDYESCNSVDCRSPDSFPGFGEEENAEISGVDVFGGL
mmetsp:Transcript_35091/g.92401  ORF Transcript_35091/g.92401 Transcript_35091/m.92401 type:complete len:167 (+) Transcript_35091:155-655(+)